MHGKNVHVFGRKVAGGCVIENVTGKSQANGFKRTLTRMCQMFDFITILRGSLQELDFIRVFTGEPEVERTLTESLILSGKLQEICNSYVTGQYERF